LIIRPGVTGLAQVQLPGDTDLESVQRKLAYDLYYVKNLNPWLDVRIILSTCFKVLGVPFTRLRQWFALPSFRAVHYHFERYFSWPQEFRPTGGDSISDSSAATIDCNASAQTITALGPSTPTGFPVAEGLPVPVEPGA